MTNEQKITVTEQEIDAYLRKRIITRIAFWAVLILLLAGIVVTAVCGFLFLKNRVLNLFLFAPVGGLCLLLAAAAIPYAVRVARDARAVFHNLYEIESDILLGTFDLQFKVYSGNDPWSPPRTWSRSRGYGFGLRRMPRRAYRRVISKLRFRVHGDQVSDRRAIFGGLANGDRFYVVVSQTTGRILCAYNVKDFSLDFME